MPRLPLAVPITSRDGTLDKGSKLVNVYTEFKDGMMKAVTRPGITATNSTLVGFGSGLTWIKGSTFTAATTTIGYLVTTAVATDMSTVKGPDGVLLGLPAYAYNNYWIVGHEKADGVSSGRGVYRTSSFGGPWTLVTTMQSGQGEIIVYNTSIFTFRRFSAGGNGTWHVGYTSDASTYLSTHGSLIGPESVETELVGGLAVHNGLVYRYGRTGILYRTADPLSSVWLSTQTTGGPSTAYQTGAMVSHNGGLYLIGATTNAAIFHTSDLSTWTNIGTGLWGTDGDMALQSFDGHLWLFGSNGNSDQFGYYSSDTSTFAYLSTQSFSTDSNKEVCCVSSFPFGLLAVQDQSLQSSTLSLYRWETSTIISDVQTSWKFTTLGGGTVSNPNEAILDFVSD